MHTRNGVQEITWYKGFEDWEKERQLKIKIKYKTMNKFGDLGKKKLFLH